MTQINIFIKDELHSKMKIYAARENIKMKELIPRAIESYLSSRSQLTKRKV